MQKQNALSPLPGEVELAMLAGFVDPACEPAHGDRKQAALVLRMRIAAVVLAHSGGLKAFAKSAAAQCGVSERTIARHFPVREALFAFPPPEMALAMVGAARLAGSWEDVELLARRVFVALDSNQVGRDLMSGLVAVHRSNPSLRAADGYFLAEFQGLLAQRVGPNYARALPLVGLFTEALRESFRVWADSPGESTTVVFDRAVSFLRSARSDDFVAPFSAGGSQ